MLPVSLPVFRLLNPPSPPTAQAGHSGNKRTREEAEEASDIVALSPDAVARMNVARPHEESPDKRRRVEQANPASEVSGVSSSASLAPLDEQEINKFFASVPRAKKVLAEFEQSHPLSLSDKALLRGVLIHTSPANRLALFKQAIAQGGNVDLLASETGDTLLMYACDTGNADIAQLFLQHGADAALKNKEGMTAFNYAEKGGHEAIKQLLIHQQKAIDTANHRPSAEASNAVSRSAVPSTASSDSGHAGLTEQKINRFFANVPEAKETLAAFEQSRPLPFPDKALLIAAASALPMAQKLALAKFGLEHRGNVNLRDPNIGVTILMSACVRGDTDLVKLYLQQGADVTLKNNKGMTLDYAVMEGHVAITQLLSEPEYMVKYTPEHLSRLLRGASERIREVGQNTGT